MTRIGYHCSQEQFSAPDLRRFAAMAEKGGFAAIMTSDHLAPWSARQGHAAQTWAWMGAAMQATADVPFGALCIPGGWRYHPVTAAQAFATLENLFPGRLPWIAAGSGEALNERAAGYGWPDKAERQERLRAGAELMRSLWHGEEITQDGPIPAEKAKLWCLPQTPPRIYAAPLCGETAAWAGTWADGIITVRGDIDATREIIDAFRQHGGKNKPLILQYQLSWAADEETAVQQAHDQWRHVAIPNSADVSGADIPLPEDFDKLSANVTPDDIRSKMMVSSQPDAHLDDIRRYAALGFDEIYLHNAGRNQKEFIQCFCEKVLPRI